MKKIIALLLAALMCVSFISCGNNNTDADNTNDVQNNAETSGEAEDTAEKFVFELNGTSLSIGDKMEKATATLGEPTDYFESVSCAFQGMDKVYTYGSVVIRTYPENDVDYIMSIELKDDSVTTLEGVGIGDSGEYAISVYGESDESSETALVYRKGDTLLTFLLTDGEITSITYMLEV